MRLDNAPKADLIVTKGRTVEFSLTLVDADGQPYNLQSGEKLVFNVRANPDDNSDGVIGHPYVLSKSMVSKGTYILTLNPSVTDLLTPGIYYYDIVLANDNNKSIKNVIALSEFKVEGNGVRRTDVGTDY
ncbi:MAG: hypothetical protein PUG48_01880 [Clostridia bacterium]|nr:hypothetical protein [Clostridia bacterium]